MSIAPEEFLSYINGALDGMVQIVEALRDERVNLRPNNMPSTSIACTPTPSVRRSVWAARLWRNNTAHDGADMHAISCIVLPAAAGYQPAPRRLALPAGRLVWDCR